MANRKIVVVGSSNTDMIIKAPRIPKLGETVLGGHFSMAAGGKGANQAVAAARAGGEVVFIARVGNDFFGERAVKSFNADRIDSSLITKDKEMPSGIALVFVGEEGQNSIAVAAGANARLSRREIEKSERVGRPPPFFVPKGGLVRMSSALPIRSPSGASVSPLSTMLSMP